MNSKQIASHLCKAKVTYNRIINNCNAFDNTATLNRRHAHDINVPHMTHDSRPRVAFALCRQAGKHAAALAYTNCLTKQPI